MKIMLIGGERSGELVCVIDPPMKTLSVARKPQPNTSPFDAAGAELVVGTVDHDEYDLIPVRLQRQDFFLYTLHGMTGSEVLREHAKVTGQ